MSLAMNCSADITTERPRRSMSRRTRPSGIDLKTVRSAPGSAALGAKFTTSSRLYVLHETIYRTLLIQARGALKKELTAHLRSRRMMRRSQHWSHKGKGRGHIRDAISIRERPPEVEDRAVPGTGKATC